MDNMGSIKVFLHVGIKMIRTRPAFRAADSRLRITFFELSGGSPPFCRSALPFYYIPTWHRFQQKILLHQKNRKFMVDKTQSKCYTILARFGREKCWRRCRLLFLRTRVQKQKNCCYFVELLFAHLGCPRRVKIRGQKQNMRIWRNWQTR